MNNSMSKDILEDLERGDRFAFGENWASFLRFVDDNRIRSAENSLQKMLECENLNGKTFLDVGSGSGLFSLAARRLGAKVVSFDYDPASVACTRFLKDKYFCDDQDWIVETGSVLDLKYLEGLGKFDVVYSWGVLHHTGEMWKALSHVSSAVDTNGRLFVALYNDQGGASRRWILIKKTYNNLPRLLKLPFALCIVIPNEVRAIMVSLVRLDLFGYIRLKINYKTMNGRGMSWWHDQIDWIGGYPFEVATPDEVFLFFRNRGYALSMLNTCLRGYGCNEFVFERTSSV